MGGELIVVFRAKELLEGRLFRLKVNVKKYFFHKMKNSDVANLKD
jgi:hypothetical protein